MTAILSSWKVWLGILLPFAGVLSLFIPSLALAVGQFLSTRGGRTVAIIAALVWLLWMAFAIVEARSYQRGAEAHRSKIEQQDNRAIEAARKARISVAECYARDGFWSVEEGLCELPQ